MSVFWDAQGTILSDYLETRRIVNSEHYKSVTGVFEGKTARNQKEKVLVHQNTVLQVYRTDGIIIRTALIRIL